MKWPFIVGFLLVLACCGQSPDTVSQPDILSNFTKDTLLINNQELVLYQENALPQFLLTISGDTVLPKADYYFKFDSIDINKDGFTDIRIYVFSNTPNQCENYLFDTAFKTFRHLENCDLDITRLDNADIYYSYDRAGCNDMNWESHLSRIDQFKLITIGYMYGQGCDDNIRQQKIDVFKVESPTGEKTRIISLPYLSGIPNPDLKWDFIHSYWEKNRKLFTH